MVMIYGVDISFSYDLDGCLVPALTEIGLNVEPGEMIAILGQNGSGKSTLTKLFNALLPLQHGKLSVAGINAGDENEVWRLRQVCGMVFQNPDNQFVSSVVEEDVAFGLENYGAARDLIPEKVSSALKAVGMEGYEKRSPQTLSGGQKQRIALAGVLALEPNLIIFDEVTAMLDPEGRREILQTIERLHAETRTTIIMITHYVEEAVCADRVCLMYKGKIISSGTPREILTDAHMMQAAGLFPPIPARLYHDLKAAGIFLQSCPLTNEELVKEICRLC